MQLRADPKLGADATSIVDLLLDVMNAGTDHGSGQRNIYPEHAYTVVSVKFADAAGAPVTLPTTLPANKEELDQTLAPVSDQKSTVRLRNPHHGNEPDETGENRCGPRRRRQHESQRRALQPEPRGFLLSVDNVTSFTAPHSAPPAP